MSGHLEELASYPFPPTPDLATEAAARLPAGPPRRRPRPALVLAVTAAVVLGAAVAAPQTRSGLVDLVDFVPGVRIDRVDELPAVHYRQTPDYGQLTSLDAASGRLGMPLLAPSELGDPDAVFVDEANDAATLMWGDRDRPRLVLTQWRGGEILFHKLLDYRSRTELAQVDGAWGIWIEGPDHDVFYGDDRRVGGYLAGNVLAWHRDGKGYRIEADVGREQALELARSLGPV